MQKNLQGLIHLIHTNKVHFLILGILIIYLCVAYPLYNRYFLKVGKPVDPASMDWTDVDMKVDFNALDEIRYEGENVYYVWGWAFPNDYDYPLEQYKKQLILVDQKSHKQFFDMQTTVRSGVTKAFPDLNRNLDHSVFSTYLSNYQIKTGIYQIGILYMRQDGMAYTAMTKEYLVCTPNRMSITNSPPGNVQPLRILYQKIKTRIKQLIKRQSTLIPDSVVF